MLNISFISDVLITQKFYIFQEFVSVMGEQVISKVPEEEKGSLKWEHVGSTSIKVLTLNWFCNNKNDNIHKNEVQQIR